MLRPIRALCAAVLLVLAALPALAAEKAGYVDSGAAVNCEGYNPLSCLPRDRQPDEPVQITLTEDWVVENSQGLVTLSPKMAGYSPDETEDLLGFPGITQEVTIDTNGHRIIVKGGGKLTLQEFDAKSCRLSVVGDGILFSVENGGTMILDKVYVQTTGPAVQLEEEAVYQWSSRGSDYPEPGTVGGGTFLVVKLHPSFSMGPLRVFDEWSAQPLYEKFGSLPVFCSVNGKMEGLPRNLPVVWDVEDHREDLEARRDCVLEGRFPAESGGWLPTRLTPKLPVKFLEPGPVQIRKIEFGRSGSGDYCCIFTFEEPYESDDVWVEVSEDQGKEWRRLDSEPYDDGDEWKEVLYFKDKSPRLYRVAVEGGPNEGVSEPVEIPDSLGQLPPLSQNDDIGGNRGGGTSLFSPERNVSSTGSGGGDTGRLSGAESRPAGTGGLAALSEQAAAAEPMTQTEEGKTDYAGEPSSGGSSQALSGGGDMERAARAQSVSSSRVKEAVTPSPVKAAEQAVPIMTGNRDGAEASPARQAAVIAAGTAVCGVIGITAGNSFIIRKLMAGIKKLLAGRHK